MTNINMDTDLITLSRHIVHEQSKHQTAHGDLTLLLVSLQVACKFVSSSVRRAGLVNLTGLAAGETTNVQGEQVKKLDVISNEIFINSLGSSGRVKIMISEENEDIITVEHADNRTAKYYVVFDPLDGSSNIDVGVSIGSIFGIYAARPESSWEKDILGVPGSAMIAAGYALYGSFTAMVLSTGNGVHGYTLDPICIKSRGHIYSCNEGNSHFWDDSMREYIQAVKKGPSPYAARYVGSMVADIHRTLLYGGIFLYPGDSKSPKGKLRLLYECFPMAFLVEKAGGKAISGPERILDIKPTSIHQRSPIILGSIEDVNEFEILYKKYH